MKSLASHIQEAQGHFSSAITPYRSAVQHASHNQRWINSHLNWHVQAHRGLREQDVLWESTRTSTSTPPALSDTGRATLLWRKLIKASPFLSSTPTAEEVTPRALIHKLTTNTTSVLQTILDRQTNEMAVVQRILGQVSQGSDQIWQARSVVTNNNNHDDTKKSQKRKKQQQRKEESRRRASPRAGHYHHGDGFGEDEGAQLVSLADLQLDNIRAGLGRMASALLELQIGLKLAAKTLKESIEGVPALKEYGQQSSSSSVADNKYKGDGKGKGKGNGKDGMRGQTRKQEGEGVMDDDDEKKRRWKEEKRKRDSNRWAMEMDAWIGGLNALNMGMDDMYRKFRRDLDDIGAGLGERTDR